MGQIRQACLTAIAIALCGLRLSSVAAPAGDSAVIVNSGSTNTAGFRIAVDRSGNAEYTTVSRRPIPPPATQPDTGPARRPVPHELVQRLYTDLEAAKPLASLPHPRCMKSVSFGTRLTIQWGDTETPDLSCGDGSNPKLRALIRDANEIVALFRAK